LRRVQSIRIGGRALEVVDLPAREMRAAHVPSVALPVRRQDERALARADQHPYAAHGVLLSITFWDFFDQCLVALTSIMNRGMAPSPHRSGFGPGSPGGLARVS